MERYSGHRYGKENRFKEEKPPAILRKKKPAILKIFALSAVGIFGLLSTAEAPAGYGDKVGCVSHDLLQKKEPFFCYKIKLPVFSAPQIKEKKLSPFNPVRAKAFAPIQEVFEKARKELLKTAEMPKLEKLINIEQMAKRFETGIPIAFQWAKKKGVIKKAAFVSKKTGAPIEEILTIAYLESTLGKYKQTDFKKEEETSSGKGIVQIVDGTFLDMVRLYGKRAAKDLAVFEPAMAKKLKHLICYVSRDKESGKTRLDEKRFKKDHKRTKKMLKTTLLDLRKGERGQTISLLLSFYDLEMSLPRLKKKIEETASPFARSLIKTLGTSFLKELIHNLGPSGAKKFLAYSNVKNKAVVLVGKKAANGNCWNGKSVAYVIAESALSFCVASNGFKKQLDVPDVPSTKKNVVAKKRVAKEMAKKEQKVSVSRIRILPRRNIPSLTPELKTKSL